MSLSCGWAKFSIFHGLLQITFHYIPKLATAHAFQKVITQANPNQIKWNMRSISVQNFNFLFPATLAERLFKKGHNFFSCN